MGSVPSTNNGLSDLLQTLKNEGSPLLSTLSSPNVEKALEKAPAGDIAQISEQALQLQATDALFGISDTPTTLGSSSVTGSSLNPLTDQLAAYQGNLQTQEAQALLGTNPSITTPSSLYDVFA